MLPFLPILFFSLPCVLPAFPCVGTNLDQMDSYRYRFQSYHSDSNANYRAYLSNLPSLPTHVTELRYQADLSYLQPPNLQYYSWAEFSTKLGIQYFTPRSGLLHSTPSFGIQYSAPRLGLLSAPRGKEFVLFFVAIHRHMIQAVRAFLRRPSKPERTLYFTSEL